MVLHFCLIYDGIIVCQQYLLAHQFQGMYVSYFSSTQATSSVGLWFLADRTNGASVCRLTDVYYTLHVHVTVAKRCVLEQKLLLTA